MNDGSFPRPAKDAISVTLDTYEAGVACQIEIHVLAYPRLFIAARRGSCQIGCQFLRFHNLSQRPS